MCHTANTTTYVRSRAYEVATGQLTISQLYPFARKTLPTMHRINYEHFMPTQVSPDWEHKIRARTLLYPAAETWDDWERIYGFDIFELDALWDGQRYVYTDPRFMVMFRQDAGWSAGDVARCLVVYPQKPVVCYAPKVKTVRGIWRDDEPHQMLLRPLLDVWPQPIAVVDWVVSRVQTLFYPLIWAATRPLAPQNGTVVRLALCSASEEIVARMLPHRVWWFRALFGLETGQFPQAAINAALHFGLGLLPFPVAVLSHILYNLHVATRDGRVPTIGPYDVPDHVERILCFIFIAALSALATGSVADACRVLRLFHIDYLTPAWVTIRVLLGDLINLF
jgi:hypothetical protein